MARKTAAELKAEGGVLGELIAAARKRPHFFALLIGRDGLVLEAHPTKAADVMRRDAKAKGGGPKGTQGTLIVTGKEIELTCENDDFPRNLARLAKRHMSERGHLMTVILLLPNGERLDDETAEEDGAEDGETDTPEAALDPPPRPAPKQPTTSSEPAAKAPPPAPAPRAPAAKPQETPPPQTDEESTRALFARVAKIIPVVKGMLRFTSPIGTTLANAVLAAGRMIVAGDLKRAAELITVLERAMANLGQTKSDTTNRAVRQKMVGDFAKLKPKIATALKTDPKGLGAEAMDGARAFVAAIKGDDLRTAGGHLSKLVKLLRGVSEDGAAQTAAVAPPETDAPGPSPAEIAKAIIAREGGYVNDPNDAGGATKYGVTIGTMRGLGLDLDKDGDVTAEDVKLLTREMAEKIFIDEYFLKPGIDKLPDSLQAPVFDMQVNSGRNAIKLLQKLLKAQGGAVTVSGSLDAATLKAAAESADLRDAYGRVRRDFYYAIGDSKPSQRRYARRRDGGKGGWITRAEEFMSPAARLTDAEHSARVAGWTD